MLLALGRFFDWQWGGGEDEHEENKEEKADAKNREKD